MGQAAVTHSVSSHVQCYVSVMQAKCLVSLRKADVEFEILILFAVVILFGFIKEGMWARNAWFLLECFCPSTLVTQHMAGH